MQARSPYWGYVVSSLLAGSILSSCASTPSLPVEPLASNDARGTREAPAGAPVDLLDSDFGTQRLFRVRYDGPEGEGAMRLVLRLQSRARYTLDASDAFGRRLWGLEVGEQGVLLVDHRQGTFCRGGEDLRVSETALALLSLSALPATLLGRFPFPLDSASERELEVLGRTESQDAQGRRWSARVKEGHAAAWTLWEGDEPLLWWVRSPNGGILSHRQGVQFRWRQIVTESLAGSPVGLLVPDAYTRIACKTANVQELRVDQPPSGGPGPER